MCTVKLDGVLVCFPHLAVDEGPDQPVHGKGEGGRLGAAGPN